MTAHQANDRGPRGALVFLGLATALAIIDSTIVNVALPSISADIGLSLTAAEWVVSGYGLALASLLISFGRVADRIGQRKVLIVGVIAFAITSLLCALAPNSAVLIAGRLLQGASAAAVLPTVQSLINSLFRGKGLIAAFAVYGATIGTAAALGPLVGSALVDWFGWPSAFLINLPIAVVVVIGILRTVPAVAGRGGGKGSDPIGQLLLLLGLAALIYGLVEAPRAGWFEPTAAASVGPIDWGIDSALSIGFVSLAVGVVVLGAFVLVERLRGNAGKPTLVDLSLFKITSFSAGSLAILVVALGEFGILFLLPLYLQVGRGLSPLQGQLVALPIALGSFISAPLTATRKSVTGRTWVMIGLGLEVAGLVLLGRGPRPRRVRAVDVRTTADLRRWCGFRHQSADQCHPAGDSDSADRAGERAVQHRTADRIRGRCRGADRDHERGARRDSGESAGSLRPGDPGGAAHGAGAGHRQQPRRPVGHCDLRHTAAGQRGRSAGGDRIQPGARCPDGRVGGRRADRRCLVPGPPVALPPS
jgi:EmrB/QacA subfamily drug resistance transporter